MSNLYNSPQVLHPKHLFSIHVDGAYAALVEDAALSPLPSIDYLDASHKCRHGNCNHPVQSRWKGTARNDVFSAVAIVKVVVIVRA